MKVHDPSVQELRPSLRSEVPRAIVVFLTCYAVAAEGLSLYARFTDFDEPHSIAPVRYPPSGAEQILVVSLLLGGLLFALCYSSRALRGRVGVFATLLLVAGWIWNTEAGMKTYIAQRLRFRPHPLLHHEFLPAHCNAVGIADTELPSGKSPDELRLVVVGDSAAYGTRVERSQRWSDLIRVWLVRDFPNRKVTIFNAAVPGYSVLSGARLARLKLFDLKPDVFIVSFNNDTGRETLPESVLCPDDWMSPLRILLYRSDIYLGLRKWLLNYLTPAEAGAPSTAFDRVSPDEIRRSYQKLLRYTAERGHASIVFSTPRYERTVDERLANYKSLIADIAREERAVFVDGFHDWRARKLFAHIDSAQHPDAYGHAQIAHLIYQAVVDNYVNPPAR